MVYQATSCDSKASFLIPIFTIAVWLGTSCVAFSRFQRKGRGDPVVKREREDRRPIFAQVNLFLHCPIGFVEARGATLVWGFISNGVTHTLVDVFKI